MQAERYVSKQTLLKLMTCLFLVIIILVGIVVIEHHRTRDYVKIKAHIVDTRTRTYNGGTDKTVEVEYVVDGKMYTTKFYTMFLIGKNKGGEIDIYCNPNNPAQLRDTYKIEMSSAISIIPIICFVLCFFIYRAPYVERKAMGVSAEYWGRSDNGDKFL